MKIYLILLFIWLVTPALIGQDKYEKEYRIPSEIVPASALEFVSHFTFTKKIKWYQEESLSGQSIEAKSKVGKQKYSIEFDTTGQLQDVELGITFKQIKLLVQDEICSSLSQEFDRFKVIKIQEQFSGNPTAILTHLTKKSDVSDFTVQYEIVLEGKKEGTVHLYEYTFSDQGKMVSKAKIILRNTDNLEY
jgi:hypothetical protein